MDRRIVFVGGVVFALIALSLVGLTPQVLLQRAQMLMTKAGGAAAKTRQLSDERQERVGDATQVLDSLPGQKKDSWADRN